MILFSRMGMVHSLSSSCVHPDMYNCSTILYIPTTQTDSSPCLHHSKFHVFEQLSNETTSYHTYISILLHKLVILDIIISKNVFLAYID